MRSLLRGSLVALAITGVCIAGSLVAARGVSNQEGEGHPEARKLKNPIPKTPSSIGRGKQLFLRRCQECHGEDGTGDGDMAEFLDKPPADLTDDEWLYGSTDGEIFSVLRDGTESDMESFKDRLSSEEMWHVVNFVRSLSEDEPEQ